MHFSINFVLILSHCGKFNLLDIDYLMAQKVNFICHLECLEYVNYIDCEGAIIIPKSVRPIISYEENFLGNKKGANKQFRYGKLHIREYDDHYVVHMDKVDPSKDPVGHLLIDAPEYLVATVAGLKAAKQTGDTLCTRKKGGASVLSAACLSGIAAATFSYILTSVVKDVTDRNLINGKSVTGSHEY